MLLIGVTPISVLLFLICRSIHKIRKRRLPFHIFISEIWAATVCLTPTMNCIANVFANHEVRYATLTLFFVAPCQLLGIGLGKLQHTISQQENESLLYIAGGALFGLALAWANQWAYLLYGFATSPFYFPKNFMWHCG